MLEDDKKLLSAALQGNNYRSFAETIYSKHGVKVLASSLMQAASELEKHGICFEEPFHYIIRNENHWDQACSAFDEVRKATLTIDESANGDKSEASLLFQENLLKTLCSLFGSNRHFDEDSGIWATVCFLHLLNWLDEESRSTVSIVFLKSIAQD